MASDRSVLAATTRPNSAELPPAVAQGRAQTYWGWVLAALIIAPVAFIELALAVSPGKWAYSAYFLTVVGCHYWLCGRQRSKRTWLLQVTTVAICLSLLHWVPWNSRKVFLAKFNHIHPGMTMSEVDDLLDDCALDARAILRETNQRGYHHSTAPRFDSDIGIVHFEHGRVTKREFLPD